MKQVFAIGVILMVLEIITWVMVSHVISGWLIFWWTLIAVFIGLGLIRSRMAGAMPQLQAMQQGQPVGNSAQLGQAFGGAFAGFLFILPGLISDVLALLVLIPPIQRKVQTALMGVLAKRQQSMMQEMMKSMQQGGMGGGAMGGGQIDPRMMEEMMRQMMGGQGMPKAGRPDVIDGEARTVQPETKRIAPANDD